MPSGHLSPRVAMLVCLAIAWAGCAQPRADRLRPAPPPRQEQRSIPGLPESARRVMRGFDEVGYNAPSDGTAYVVDETARRVITSQRMFERNQLRATPGRNEITLDGRIVYDQPMAVGNTHAIWWVEDNDEGGGGRGER